MEAQDDHFRPQYHFSPRTNWMNDPNGLVYYQGEYHLFYQYHPGSPVWGPMHWGHAVSKDLIHWQHLPIALYPDENGMIFSGSAVIDWENTAGFGKEAMVAIFTHATPERQAQSLAYSTDRGRTWTKHSGNPVLLPPEGLRDFRDPKVFWYSGNSGAHWVMVLAAHDAVRFYISPDLIHWTPGGIFGEKHGAHGGVWETPDLFKLPVENGPESRWVLTAGIGNGGPGGSSGMQYFIGDFDGKTFLSGNPEQTVLWADFGADYYAAQSWSDLPGSRRIMIGWQNNWQYAQRIPPATWRGVFSLPREVTLKQTPDGIRLFQQPAREVFAQRGAHEQWQHVSIAAGNNLLGHLAGGSFEFNAEFHVNPRADRFGFRVRVGEGEQTTIGYAVQQQRVFVDRVHSGQMDFDEGFASVHSVEMKPVEGVIRLQIFLDRSCIEVFGNAGQVTIADTIYPAEQSLGLDLFSEGAETVLNVLDVYQMMPARFEEE
jgi:fructan beta-fructosidase